MLTTDGCLLDGRVRYAQPADGYRTGIEPVLLAASVAAHAGQRVLEAGAGAGAGLLCLAARVPGIVGVGVEIDPDMAALARRNIEANDAAGLSIVTGDIGTFHGEAGFDHAFSNPPWHDPAATPSPTARRSRAKQMGGLPLEGWIESLRAALRTGGSLTLMLPAGQTVRAVAGMRAAGFGRLTLAPLWPKLRREAKLLLVQGLAGRKDPDRIVPGLILHDADGGLSPDAQRLLRGGAAMVV